MQLNTLRTVQLTMSGLNRLKAADAPGDGAEKLGALIDEAAAEHRAAKAAFAKDGTGSYEALVICARKAEEMAALSQSIAQAKAWGAREVAATAAGLAEQIVALRADEPDASLAPKPRTRKLAKERASFVDEQNATLARYEDELGRGELTAGELRSLVAGRRDLVKMWELSHNP
jgi:hypothetical protein